MYEYPFEKLKIWQNGKELAVEVYSTANSFPAKDKSGIGEYLKEAAVKVTTSLSEGNWRTSSDNARASLDDSHLNLMELLSLVIVARDLEVLSEEVYHQLREKINDLSIMLLAFKKSLNNKADKKVGETAATL